MKKENKYKCNYICKECGKEFESYIKLNSKYCNQKCYLKNNSIRLNPTGVNSNMYGKKHTEEAKRKMSKKRKGVPKSEEWKKNMKLSWTPEKKKIQSEQKLGKNNPFYGKKHTDKTKQKIRVKNLARISESLENGHQLTPFYNKNACKIFDNINNELEWHGIHAQNSGEYHIKKLGYFTDYYEEENNIVIEYYEKHHYSYDGILSDRDVRREREISEYLSCSFYRINAFDVSNIKFEKVY